MPNYEPGQRVILRADPDEGWPRQEATIVGTTEMPWGLSIMVRVTPEDIHDDGLREVTESQIE